MIWKCANPHCKHTLTVPKSNRSILIGRATICPACNDTAFVLTSEDVKLKRPVCRFCKPGEKGQEARRSRDIVSNAISNVMNQILEAGEKETE